MVLTRNVGARNVALTERVNTVRPNVQPVDLNIVGLLILWPHQT